MTYEEFRAYLARYGFTSCPVSKYEYEACQLLGLTQDQIYGVACDVNAGLTFQRALACNSGRQS